MNDETIFDQNQNDGQETELNNLQTTPAMDAGNEVQHPQPIKETKKQRGNWKTAGVAGAAGAVVGSFIPLSLFPDQNQEFNIEEDVINETEPAPQPAEHLQGHEMEVATSVDDSMSFNQAFAAARREVGPGGLFAWHGRTFGTYYGNEWNAMTPDEKAQYWVDVHHTTSHINDELLSTSDSSQEPLSDLASNLSSDNTSESKVDENQEIKEVNDIDDDGVVDADIADGDGSETPEAGLETTDDVQSDTLVLDPSIDETDQIVVEEPNEDPLDDLQIVANEPSADGTLVVDAGDDETPDLMLDTIEDDESDTLTLDPTTDEEGNLFVGDEDVSGIDDAEITPDVVMENVDTDVLSGMPDVDDLSMIPEDPDIPIDNQMDMDEFI